MHPSGFCQPVYYGYGFLKGGIVTFGHDHVDGGALFGVFRIPHDAVSGNKNADNSQYRRCYLY